MLTDLKTVLLGRRPGSAVGAFNTPNLETLLAVLNAAEKRNLPVIVAHAQIHEETAPLDCVGPVMLALAARAKVPVCVHLDHGEDLAYLERALKLGFTSVMYDGSALSYEENLRNSAEAGKLAHAFGASLEAELGRLAAREGGGGGEAESVYTDPGLVPEFARKTGADALAIAFGTAHGIYAQPPKLNFDVVSGVAEATDLPLVMHGGSGVSAGDYREAIRRGIAKINYYTYLSYDGFAAAKRYAEESGKGFYHDLALSAQLAMEENAGKTMDVFKGVNA